MSNSMQAHASAIPTDLPPNVNPFAYTIEYSKQRSLRPLPQPTIIILGFLLAFHSLIVLFCSFILIISFISGGKKALWFVRRLYIKDDDGKKTHKTTIYFLNCGVLMNISQLLCSCVAQAYLWMQIKSSQSPEYALHAQIMPCFGLTYIFETISYWSMTHCFLVTMYFSQGFNWDVNSGIARWISLPFVINAVFIGFPVFVTVVTFALMSWTTITHNRFTAILLEFKNNLNKGSSTWDKLHYESLSNQDQAQWGAQMVEITSNVKRLSDQKDYLIHRFIGIFRVSQIVMLVLVIMSGLVFVLMFLWLISSYRRTSRQPSRAKALPTTDWCPGWLKRENFGEPVSERAEGTSTTNMSIILPNRQFFYLLLRALGVFLSIITLMAVSFLVSWKTKELILQESWRGITAWLLTLSSVWPAVPIAWQCWSLHVDEAHSRAYLKAEEINLTSREFQSNDRSADEHKKTHFDIKFPFIVNDSTAKLPP